MRTRSLLLAAMLCTGSVTAAAQGYPPPPPPPAAGPNPGFMPMGPQRTAAGFWPRRGFYGGIGLGGGEMTADCQSCGSGSLGSVSVHLDGGFQLNPRLGLFLDVWGLIHGEDTRYGRTTLTHNIFTVGAQLWVTPQIWIKGGLGSSWLRIADDGGRDATSDTVAGAMIAAGVELLNGPRFSLDLEARAGNGFYSDGSIQNVGVELAVHWHSLWSSGVMIVN